MVVPSNPVTADAQGNVSRILPEGQSSREVVTDDDRASGGGNVACFDARPREQLLDGPRVWHLNDRDAAH